MKINMIKRILLLWIISGSFVSYAQVQQRINKALQISDYSKVDLKSSNNRDTDLIESKIIGDTLCIVSTSPFLYYPLGVYNSIDNFSKNYGLTMDEKTEYDYSYNDSTTDKTVIYRLSFGNSFIKFLKDDEKNKLEIVSGKVKNKEIYLTNGITIRINISNNFIKKFITDINSDQIKSINIVKMVSGLTGIWHYYFFKGDTLNYFYFDTDYQVTKE